MAPLSGPRNFATFTVTHLLILTFGLLGLVALLSGSFYTAALYGRFATPRQPTVRTVSLPHLVLFPDATTNLVYQDLGSPSNITSCGGSCLLDPYGSGAGATCTTPSTGFIDHWVQLYHRELTFSNGVYFSVEGDLSEASFGLYTAVTVISWTTLVFCVYIIVVFFSMRQSGAISVAVMDDTVFRPMFDARRAVLAAFVFAGASVFGMVLGGDSVVTDLQARGLTAGFLVLLSLSLERDVGSFLAVHHSSSYDGTKSSEPHELHHATFRKILIKWVLISLVQIMTLVFESLAAYNYNLPDPGLATAYRSAVNYGSPYTARWFRICLEGMLCVYHIVPPLLHLIPIFETMRGVATAASRQYGDFVRHFAIGSLIRTIVITGVLVILATAPPMTTDPASTPLCA